MANRLDALTAREYTDRDGNKKTSWTRIGAAFETQNGWSIVLDALPVPSIGERGLETKILLMPPKPKDDKPAQQRGNDYASQSGGRGPGPDDEIEF